MIYHLKFIYYFFSLLSGIFVLALGLAILIKTKNSILRNYLCFFIFFTIKIFSWIIGSYLLAVGANDMDDNVIVLFIGSFSINFMMWSLPLFIHSLFDVPFAKWLNRIFFIIPIAGISIFLINKLLLTNPIRYDIIGNIILMSIIVYIIVISAIYYKKIENRDLKNITKTMITLTLLFLPVFTIDSFFPSVFMNFILLSSLYYSIWNGVTFYYALKYFSNEHHTDNSKNITDDIYKKFNISEREKEIIQFLLKGYSYGKIAEIAFISLSTVKTHTHNIYNKTGTKSRHELTYLFRDAI